MKKWFVVLCVFALLVFLMAGCTGSGASEGDTLKEEVATEEQSIGKFTEEGTSLVYLDLENAPFDGFGLKTIVERGEMGSAKFIKTDLSGIEGEDYYLFNYSDNTFEKYTFVSAMGKGYYYHYDLETNELIKIEDKDRNDVTQSMKDGNRWDAALEGVKEDIEALEGYFKTEHETSIKDFVTEK